MRLIDTNVILRFLLADRDDERYQGVYLLFNRLEDGFEKVECKLLVFFQAIFVLKSFYKVNKATISEMMVKLLDYKGFYIEKRTVIKRTLELWKQHNIEIIDSYLIACLEEKGETEIYSYDAGFDKFIANRMEP